MTKPLVTHVLWTLERGGAERVVFDLARQLPMHGFRTRVLTVAGAGSWKRMFDEQGIDVHAAPIGTRMEAVRFLRDEMRHDRPAILHTHLGADVWGGIAAWCERMHPWIVTLHNEDRDIRTTYHLARRIAYKRADQIVCVSDAVRLAAKRLYRVPDAKLSVIPNGIDFARVIQRPYHSFHDVPRLIAVGRLVPQKDHATLLTALAQVHRPWRLTIVGEGAERSRLRELATTLGLLPRIDFIGVVDDLPQRLAEHDLFCFPSRWEGQGLALLEAAAAGIPCLASDLPVLHEMFDDRAISYTPSGSVAAWSVAIAHALAHPEVMLAKTPVAAAIVRKRYDLTHSVERYARLYHSLIAQ